MAEGREDDGKESLEEEDKKIDTASCLSCDKVRVLNIFKKHTCCHFTTW